MLVHHIDAGAPNTSAGATFDPAEMTVQALISQFAYALKQGIARNVEIGRDSNANRARIVESARKFNQLSFCSLHFVHPSLGFGAIALTMI